MTFAEIRNNDDLPSELVFQNGEWWLKAYNAAGRNWTMINIPDFLKALRDQAPSVFGLVTNNVPGATAAAHAARQASLQSLINTLNSGQCLIATQPTGARVAPDGSVSGVTGLAAITFLRQ